jgi:predicted DCC family thiol-disulfide oxidoreductase YuxK
MHTARPSTVYVDAECVLCSRTAQWIRRHDRRGYFQFDSLQSLGQTAPQSVVVCDGDRTYTRSRAVVQVLWRLGGRWKLLALLLYLIPSIIRDAVYTAVARHRHRLVGSPRCTLPTNEQ